MKRFLAALAVTALFGGSLNAADLAPVYRPAPPVVAYFIWAGCYIGGNVCGLWAERDWRDQILDDPLYGTDLGSYTTRGVLGGARAGCNHQIGAGVFGIQVYYWWSNASGSNVLLAALALP
jgi:opacity protein-like surface antigen